MWTEKCERNEVGEMRVRRRDARIKFFALGIFAAVFLFTFLTQHFKKLDDGVEAASLANFDPGYIISDYQMGNYNSMSEAEIQAFLTAKNSCKNTNYDYYLALSNSSAATWHFKDGHFVCLSEELFGDGEVIGSGETAAHIIWQTAQDYKINPQVLLVLLQKETSLITDPIPNNYDYRKATGYGCPDTAPCSSQYYGFKNQVRKAAALFRTVLDGGWTNYPLGNNYIQYNPNADCGGSVVNIRSLATSALYRYTPYQPNAGALAAGYGTAYCGAYGNRNFYLYFEDWFGGVTASKTEWENMQSPRVMIVNKPTLIINTEEYKTTNEWLGKDKNYYFTKKTTVFWNNEQQTCLQRKIDEGTSFCVLMSRLTDFSINEKTATLLGDGEYEVRGWTCIVNILRQNAECERKEYAVGDIISANMLVVIDDKEYLILDNNYAVLKMKTKPKLKYEKIGPKLMKLKNNSYKYDNEGNRKIQQLDAVFNEYISIMDKVVVVDRIFYRTSYDHNNKNDYLILASDLVENIFTTFVNPRNLEFINDASSVDLDNNGQICNNYTSKTIRKFINKINYNGEEYFQNEEEEGTHCVVKNSDLRETEYNFNNENLESNFVDFLLPRKLKIVKSTYMIDAKNGKTCEVFLQEGNTQKYVTKIDINGMAFYRTVYKTETGSFCVVPAVNLAEVN